jgi:nucleotide-binding universal stress UspA family protein
VQPINVTFAGAVLAFTFAASVGGVIYWMLHVPELTPATLLIARAVRQAEHANLVLVPVQGSALSDRMVALGSQMAKARQARIEVFYVVEVPWTLPLDARLPGADELSAQVLARAEAIAARYGVHLETHVVNAREAGRAIVEEVIATGADIVLMGDVPKRPGSTRFSTTTAYVFSHAPSEVIIDRPAVAAIEATRSGEVQTNGR